MGSSVRRPACRYHGLSAGTLAAVLLIWLTVGFLTIGRAYAHGDDEHAAPVVLLTPRAEVRSGTLELVTLYSRDVLALFVSRFSDGAPVTGVQVRASTDLEDADMRETDPGVYVTRDLVVSPGRNDLKFTIAVAGQPEQTQKMALLVPGGVLISTQVAMTTTGRHNRLVLAGAVIAVYAVMTLIFLLSGRQASTGRVAPSLRSQGPQLARLGRLVPSIQPRLARWVSMTGSAISALPRRRVPSVVPVTRRS